MFEHWLTIIRMNVAETFANLHSEFEEIADSMKSCIRRWAWWQLAIVYFVAYNRVEQALVTTLWIMCVACCFCFHSVPSSSNTRAVISSEISSIGLTRYWPSNMDVDSRVVVWYSFSSLLTYVESLTMTGFLSLNLWTCRQRTFLLKKIHYCVKNIRS
jgi:hypothetical protein